MSPARRRLLLAAAAFCLYGGWAFLANRSHGTAAAAQAFLIQGGLSFASMLTITIIMEWAFARCGSSERRQFLSAVAAVCLPMYLLTVGLHLAAGTPELVATVAPVLTVGTVYCGGYSLGLVRLGR